MGRGAERVNRQFQLFKPIAKELKFATIDSEERYGQELSQQDVVNFILARHFKMNYNDMKNGTRDGLEPNQGGVSEGSMAETEAWNEGEEELVKEPRKPMDSETLNAVLVEIRDKKCSFDNISCRIADYKDIDERVDEIREACKESGIEFILSNGPGDGIDYDPAKPTIG